MESISVKESIQKFENKKEFREVKLSTKKSFREDQSALEERLKKYRSKSTSSSDSKMSDGLVTANTVGENLPLDIHENGHVVECENDVLIDSGYADIASSQVGIDNVVLDLSDESGDDDDVIKERVTSTDDNVSEKDSTKSLPNLLDDYVCPSEPTEKSDNDKVYVEATVEENSDVILQKTSDVSISETCESVHTGSTTNENVQSKQNSSTEINSTTDINSTTEIPNDKIVIPNGHTVIPNGKSAIPNGHGGIPIGHTLTTENGYSSLIARPKAHAQLHPQQQQHQQNGNITPEPKIKMLRGIYQKNPKLNAAGSMDHLDNISLRSFRSGPKSQDIRQYAGPIVPSAEVTSIPPDGNLLPFNVAQMVTVFRLLRLPGELIYKLSKSNVDGRRFAAFTDQELEDLGMNNPIIRYFRDRSVTRPGRRKKWFIL